MTTTPLMSLDLPTVGVGGTAGPEYGDKNNTAFEKIDEHNHTTGKGAKIPVAGLDINADVNLETSYNLTNARAVRLANQPAVLANVSDKNQLVSVNGNLVWQNASGVNVQLTDGSGINIASVGTIGGDYGQPGVTAAATYSDIVKSFSWTQASGITAKMNSADLSISHPGAGENAVTLKAQTGSAAYNLIFPLAAPAVNESIQVYNSTGVGSFKTITGTTNQVTVTPSASSFALSLPQNINTTASPTFNGISLTSASIGTGDLTNLNANAFNFKNQVFDAGTYNPIPVNVPDFTGYSTVFWIRVGNLVFVNGTIWRTSPGETISSYSIPLPVARGVNFNTSVPVNASFGAGLLLQGIGINILTNSIVQMKAINGTETGSIFEASGAYIKHVNFSFSYRLTNY